MWEANLELKATQGGKYPIEFAEIIEAHPEADTPYLLQKEVPIDGVNFKDIKLRNLITNPDGNIALVKSYPENQSYSRKICKERWPSSIGTWC